MSAVVSAVGDVIGTASADWDPIGNWSVNSMTQEATNFLKEIEKVDAQINPIQPVLAEITDQIGSDIRRDTMWSAEAIHDLGTSGDQQLKNIGLNPDSVKMAIVGVFAPYAVPLLQAALVKARGGSWEDAALSAATAAVASYVGGQVGSYVGDYTQSAFAGAPTTAAGVAAEYGIGATSQQAATIAAQNASVLGVTEMAASNIAARVAAAGAGSATGQLIANGTVDLNKTLTAMSTAGITSAVPALTSQIPGFSSLPAAAQSAINKTVAGSLQGKDLNAMAATLALDTAMAGVQSYYKDALGGLTNTYNSAVSSFSDLSSQAAPYIQSALDSFNSLTGIKTSYDTKVDQYNDLVASYNTTHDATTLAQINALKPEITALQDQYVAGGKVYDQQLADLNPYQQQLDTAMTSIQTSRDQYFNNAALAINPSADWKAYAAFDPTVKTEMDSTGKTAAQIYFERINANPNVDQTTTWTEAVQKATPEQLVNLDEAYKAATGFDLTPQQLAAGNVDPTTFSLYQEQVAGSVPWYLAEAEKAKQAGDFTKYTQLMSTINQTYSGAYGQDLGADGKSLSTDYLKNILGVVGNQTLAQQALGTKYVNQAPTTSVTPSGKTITNYGFGVLNPLLGSVMTENDAKNPWMRETYTYDPTQVENALKGINVMDFSSNPNQLSTFQQNLQGTASAGGRLFLPTALQQNLQTEFSNLGNSAYNTGVTQNALDYLKSGTAGGLGSYMEAYTNPYAIANTNTTSTGGLNQIASNWAATSGVTNPTVQKQLATSLVP